MAILETGKTWTNEQITPAGLNQTANSATFAAGAVDGTTTALSGGSIIVKDLGITAAKLATGAVTTAKILDDNVTTAKILDGNVTAAKLASDSVTTAKILDANVTIAKVEAASIATTAEMKAASATKLMTLNLLKHHPGVAKAWGVVVNTGATTTLRTGSHGVTSVAQSGATNWTRVTLAAAMDSTNYVVQATQEVSAAGSGASDKNAAVAIVSTTTFDIGNNDALSEVHFTVFGNLA